ncbi:hypothetical protein APHAL10511_006448 [Amanita phalloides]|nr:hypothetical protein APHAL10511_006448 [Amanita phalloides]
MSRWKSSFSLNPAWFNILGLSMVALAVAAGLFRHIVLDWMDPMRCGALLNKGSWLDREQLKWQPDGCMLHDYSTREIRQCFGQKRLIFAGDSTTRKLFYQTARILDNKLPAAPPRNNQKHADVDLSTSYGIGLSFIWDPYLNSSHVYNLIEGRSNLRPRPALLVIGSGLWYMRYSSTSGGLPAWQANMGRILHGISESKAKISDAIVMLPIEQVVPSKLSPERAATMRSSDIDAMNSYFLHRISPPSSSTTNSRRPSLPVALPLVFNQMLAASLTEDGLHYADSVIRAQATILLNMRCNGFLPKVFPFDKTCCNRYPRPSFVHTIVLLAIILWGPYTYLKSANAGDQNLFTLFASKEAAPLTLSVSIAIIFVADRTGIWLKEHKHFDSWTFGLMCFGSLFYGLVTVKHSDKDLGFLNRDQTDEWKGWMQVFILIYHYLGASKVSGVYNPTRVLVAAYLFMTGFGHTTYYLRKADFSFLRIAQVLVRLNLLTLLLAYAMNTNYLSYYFAPLVSWWYLVVYGTMVIASHYNDRTLVVLCKIISSAFLVTVFIRQPRLLEFLFGLLEHLCNVRWQAREWTFRVTLDLWVVYAGMIFALACHKCNSLRVSDDPRWPLVAKIAVGLSFVALMWYLVFELSQKSKYAYNAWHPYVSFIPILAFVVLRNATVILRSAHSQAFAFIGKCSLETFIIQYHLWLAGDTKGILLVIPGTKWRPINFLITTFIFIYISDRVAHATSYIANQISGAGFKSLPTSMPSAGRPPIMNQVDVVEDSKESPLLSDVTWSLDSVLLRLRLLIDKYHSKTEARMSLIIIVMWLVNLMWPAMN